LKIVHISETFVTGVQSYLWSLTQFLSQNASDAKIYIIYSGQRKEFDDNMVKKLFAGKATLIEVPMAAEISPLSDAKATRQIYRELKKIKPDVIHLHSSKATILGRLAAFLYGGNKKLFYTPHGYSFLRTDVSKTKTGLFKAIEKYAQLFLGGTTVACGDTEYEIARTFGKAVLVRNGLSVDESIPAPALPDNTRLTVGIVSRITFARSPKLFNEIALRFPDIDFVWIGDGELREALTAPNIRITGWLSGKEQVAAEIQRLDVYMQTSLWEGLPYAVLEAMALRKPVVATNVIGNKDIVVHGETGFLFTDISELDACFARLKDAANRSALGQAGYRRCLELFNNNTNFKGLLELYRA